MNPAGLTPLLLKLSFEDKTPPQHLSPPASPDPHCYTPPPQEEIKQEDVQNRPLTLAEARVKKALESKLLESYVPFLSRKVNSWQEETYYEQIVRMANPGLPLKKNLEPLSEDTKLLYELFVIAIDPELDASQRRAFFTERLDALNAAAQDKFKSFLGYTEVYAISANLLLYCEGEIIQEILKMRLPYLHLDETYDNPIVGWLDAIKKLNLPEAEKFLEKLCGIIPAKEYQRLYQDIFLKNSAEGGAALLAQAPIKVREGYQEFVNQLEQDYKEIFAATQSKQAIDWSYYADRSRRCILKLCKERFFDDLRFAYIAVVIDDKEWRWLRKQVEGDQKPKPQNSWSYYEKEPEKPVSEEMVAKAFVWFQYVTEHPEVHKKEEWNNKAHVRLSGRSCFFRYICECIDANEGWCRMPESLIDKLTPKDLQVYTSSFSEKFWLHYLPRIIKNKPAKFMDLLKECLTGPLDICETRRGKIEKIFSYVKHHKINNSFSEEAQCSDLANSFLVQVSIGEPATILSIYRYLNRDERKHFLSELYKDKKRGHETIIRWLSLCFTKINPCQPIVREELLKDLAANLNYVCKEFPYYQMIPNEIYKLISKLRKNDALKDIPEIKSLIEEFNVSHYGNQSRAIEKIKRYFSLTEVSFDETRIFIASIHYDLEDRDVPTVWLAKLFDALPKQMWPLILIYFQHAIIQRHNPQSFFHHKEGTDLPKSWLDDPKKWEEMAYETLIAIRGNPLLRETVQENLQGRAVLALFEVLKSSATDQQVLKRFVKTAPSHLIISTLAHISGCYMTKRQDECHDSFSKLFTNEDVDREEFIADCICGSFEHDQACDFFIKSFKYHLLAYPYLKTYDEVLDVLFKLMAKLGPKFIDFYSQAEWWHQKFIIKALTYLKQPPYLDYVIHWLKQMLHSTHPHKMTNALRLLEACHENKISMEEILFHPSMEMDLQTFKDLFLIEFQKQRVYRRKFEILLLTICEPTRYPKILISQLEIFLGLKENKERIHSIIELFNELKEVGVEEEMLHEIRDSGEVLDKLKQLLHEHFQDFYDYRFFSINVVTYLLPDAIQHYIDLTLAKVENCLEKIVEYGSEKSDYSEVVNLFKALEDMGLFQEFYKNLMSQCPQELRDSVTEARYQAFPSILIRV